MQAKSKQLVSTLVAGFMAIVLIACGGGGGSSPPPDTPVTAPTIDTQPAPQTVTEGQSATFTVAASGTTPGYQWKKDGADISGANSSSYTIAATSSADTGVYSVVVSNSAGNVTSGNATLTVSAVPPAIGTQPLALAVTAGQPATFTVTASGASLSYQWKKNGVNISDATYSSHTIASTSIADTGEYSVVVSNSAGGSVTSANAKLTVSAVSPVIATQPAALTKVNAGYPATFSVTATGTAPISYQWKKNGTDISGATSSTYTTPATSLGEIEVQFAVVVTNSAGTVTSNPAKLTVYANAAPHTSVTASQCYKASNYALVSCSSNEAQALNSQQDGNRATIGAKSYSEVPKADGTYYDKTECVKDNITGLMWEGKTDSGARAGSNTYTNDGHATAYVTTVNSNSGLCGFKDWRLPTAKELQTLLNYGVVVQATPVFDNKGKLESIRVDSPAPTIDTTWFPNTQGSLTSYYWSSSPYVGDTRSAWYVRFSYGAIEKGTRSGSGHLRLVR